jgi:hypothetical protein
MLVVADERKMQLETLLEAHEGHDDLDFMARKPWRA